MMYFHNASNKKMSTGLSTIDTSGIDTSILDPTFDPSTLDPSILNQTILDTTIHEFDPTYDDVFPTVVVKKPRRKLIKPLDPNYKASLENMMPGNARLTGDAVALLNDIFARLSDRLASHFINILMTANTSTLTADMIANAVLLVFTPNLAEESVAFGLERVKQFKASKQSGGRTQHEQTDGRISRTVRAGLSVDVSLATNVLRAKLPLTKNKKNTSLSTAAPVMMAAIIQNVAAKIIDIAITNAPNAPNAPSETSETTQITGRVVSRTIRADRDLRVSIGPFILFDQ